MNNLHNMAKVYSESVYLPYISYIYIYVQQIMAERYIEVDLVSKLTIWQKKNMVQNLQVFFA